MFLLLPWAVLFVLEMLSTEVKAQNTINTVVNITYYPEDAWSLHLNPACDSPAQYTQVVNATASFVFTGNRFQLGGLGYSANSLFQVLVDNQSSYFVYSSVVGCALLVDYSVGNGTHDVAVSLLGHIPGDSNDTAPPALYLNEIYYWPNYSQTTPPSKSASHVGAIVGGVVGSVAGLVVVALGLFYYFKRRMPWSRKGRHSFDSTAANRTHIIPVELSPTKATFQPYSRMDDGQYSPPEDIKYGVVGRSGAFSSEGDQKADDV